MTAATTRFDDLDSRRQEAGISYAALAKLSGVSHPALQRLLTGKVEGPTLTSIAAIARVLGMAAVRFLDDGSIKFDPTVSAKLSASVRRAKRPSAWSGWSRALPRSRARR